MRIQNITSFTNPTNYKLHNVSTSRPTIFLGDDDDDDKKLSQGQKVALVGKLALATAVGIGIGLLIANRQKIMRAIMNRYNRNGGYLPNNQPPAEPVRIPGGGTGQGSSGASGGTSITPKIEEVASGGKPKNTPSVEEVQVVEVVAKNKIKKPEYLYHMTSEAAYKSIMHDCVIKKSTIEDGVFLSDLKSLEKYPKGELQKMANWYAGGAIGYYSPHPKGKKVYVFKIPTETLKDNLDFRAISLTSAPVKSPNPFVAFPMYGAEETASLLEKPLEFVHKGEIPVAFSSDIIEFSVNDISKPNFRKILLDKLK